MRQAEMDLLLAKDEYEIRSYFLCGASARTNNVDGTSMILTNKRLVLEYMNNFEVSRKEIPIDQITFVKSHYYEEEEDPTFANNCMRKGILFIVFSILSVILGVVGLTGIFDMFSLFGLNIPLLNLVFVVIAIVLLSFGISNFRKAKKFKPRIGKRLELLIGTSLDFDKGLSFTTDSTGKLRDNMRTYSGTKDNSLIGKVSLSPTREAKKMTNELGALIIDIKAGLYNEDPAIKAKREAEEKERIRQEKIQEKNKVLKEQKVLAEENNNEKKSKTETTPLKKKSKPQVEVDEKIKKDREARMAKYGVPMEELDEDELEDDVPSAISMQFKKSKMKPPQKKKSEDELIDEEYEAIMKSLNMN